MRQAHRPVLFCILFVLLTTLAALVPGCGGEKKSSEPDTTAPAAVGDLRVQATGCDNVVLAWTASGDDSTRGRAASYDLRYSHATITEANWAAATQCQSEPTPKTSGQAESMTVPSLASDTTYYFAIKVRDSDGNESGLSNVCTSTTGTPAVQWVYDGLGADETWTNSTTQLSANWAAASCADSYDYAVGTTQGGTDVVDWTSTGAATTVTHPGLSLSEAQTYYFSVRGVHGAVHGDAVSSNGLTVDTTAPSSSVTALPAEEATLVFSVSWTGSDAASGISRYDIQVKEGAGAWSDWLAATEATSSTYSGTDGHTYYFRSRAEDNAGNVEAYPATEDASTTVDLPGKPEVAWVNDGLASDEDWTNATSQLSANWAAAAGVDGYEYAIGMTPGATNVVTWTSTGTQRSVTRTGLSLAEGQTYYFSVRVVVGDARGNPVSSDGSRVDRVPPTSSVSSLAQTMTTLVFNVAWTGSDDLSGIKQYDIQVKDGTGSWTDWLLATTLTASDFTGTLDHTYAFRSRARDNAGNVEAYPSNADASTAVACAYSYFSQWGSQGTGDGYFDRPFNVATDVAGNVYVVESTNCRV